MTEDRKALLIHFRQYLAHCHKQKLTTEQACGNFIKQFPLRIPLVLAALYEETNDRASASPSPETPR